MTATSSLVSLFPICSQNQLKGPWKHLSQVTFSLLAPFPLRILPRLHLTQLKSQRGSAYLPPSPLRLYFFLSCHQQLSPATRPPLHPSVPTFQLVVSFAWDATISHPTSTHFTWYLSAFPSIFSSRKTFPDHAAYRIYSNHTFLYNTLLIFFRPQIIIWNYFIYLLFSICPSTLGHQFWGWDLCFALCYTHIRQMN